MAVRKGQLTKTITVAGGMQDDVPEFHQEHPTCAYIENGRFRKVNEIEKRLPDVALSDTGLPSTGDPLTLASQGETLLTLDEAGSVFTRDTAEGTGWEEYASDTIPYSVETSWQGTPAPGIGIIAAGESSGLTTDYRLIAWEERVPNQTKNSNDSTVSLVIEARSLNGSLITRDRVDGRSPKCTYFNDGVPVIYYCDSNGLMWLVNRNAFSAALVHTSTTLTCDLEHPEIAGRIANDAAITHQDDLRVGWLEDGGASGMFHVGYDPFDGSEGALVYKTGTTVKAAKLSSAGTPATPFTIATDSGTVVYTPLSVAPDTTGDAGFLVSYNDTAAVTTGSGDLFFLRWDMTAETQSESFAMGANITGTDCPRIVNASLVYDHIGPVGYRFATTVTTAEPEAQRSFLVSDTAYVASGAIDETLDAFNVENRFQDHRLVSEVTFRQTDDPGDSRDLLFCLEQWVPLASPWTSLTPVDEFATVPVLIKPVTTLVIITSYENTDGSYNVIATLGAGQNKGYNASSSEQSPHLNSAFVVGEQPSVVTRTLLQPEDISLNMLAAGATGDRMKMLFPGEGAPKVIRLTPATSLRSRAFGDITYFATGVPTQFDGTIYGEAGVFDQPEITYFDAAPADGDGATDADDMESISYEKLTDPTTDEWCTYQVVVGFADHLGQLHRSAPSIPLWVDGLALASRADDENQVELGYTMPLSVYKSGRDYFVEVFMGLGSASPQLVATQYIDVSLGHNVITPPSIVVQHTVRSHSSQKDPIRSSEVLYTEGNVLPSDPWPAFDDFVITSNRMFAISSEVPGTIYYSKLLEENIAPEFSAALVLSVGRNRTLTGLGAIDDKVMIFSKDEIFAIYDTGPDNTGANGDFIVDRLQTTVGCEDAESIVEITDGLCFYSSVSKEFHLISRDLQIHDIGKAIEDTANAITDVKAAIIVPDEHEVRWYVDSAAQAEFGTAPGTTSPVRPARPRYQNVLPSGAVLVYNYHYKKWCVFSGQDAKHAVLHENAATYIETNYNPFQADTSAWGTDTDNLLKVRLPWLRVNQLQSYGRIDELTVLGKYLSDWTSDPCEAGDLQVTLTYDYEGYGADSDVYRFRANRGDMGEARMQLAVHPGRPKCQAVQVEFEEIATTAVEVWEPTYRPGRGFVLAGIDLNYTPLSGTGSKTLPAAQRK